MKTNISLIIPLFNEEENIERLILELNNYCQKFNQVKLEVIFVDDGSTDNSSVILERSQHNYYAASIVKLSKNYGSHPALRAGILHSTGEFITFLSADLQDPLDLVRGLYKKCEEGYDIVFAFRNKTKYDFVTKFFSRLYARLMRIFVVSNFPENGFDIVMFNHKVRDELNQNIESHSSLFLQIFTMGFKQASITYDKNPRLFGKSKWTLSKKIKMIIDSFVGFSYAPIRFVSMIGIMLSLLGFMWMFYIVIRAILFRDLQPGWPSLIAILMIGFGLTNISLGIIAEYLWRTLDASKRKKAFVINRIISCNKNMDNI